MHKGIAFKINAENIQVIYDKLVTNNKFFTIKSLRQFSGILIRLQLKIGRSVSWRGEH